MPFIRLSDNYIDHPKFLALSASAFRLWHEGMAFCRKHQTDGLIPLGTLQGFRYYKAVWARELATAYKAGGHPLWETVEGFGFKVHDYLFWNLSKEEEQSDKDAATARMRRLRKVRRDGVCSPEHIGERSPTCAPFVPDRRGEERAFKGKGSGENPTELAARAGRLREELYPDWYAKHRRGARLRLIASSLEFQDALTLVQTWDDERIEKLAVIVLTTDDEWISRTDRGFRIFALKASWADDKLREWEAQQGKTA